MESTVIFRDRQELQAADMNNAENFARASLDHVVYDGIDPSKSYAGFAASKTGVTEVTLESGRLYAGGPVYARDETVVVDLFNTLPLVTRKRVAIVAWGQSIDTDVQPRDFIIDAQTGQTEPQSVAMESTRRCEIASVAGVEGPDPQYPAIDANVLVVAYVLLDTTGIVSIEQWTANRIQNVRGVANRASALEAWRAVVGAQVDTLRTDLSNLAQRFNALTWGNDIMNLTDQLEAIRNQLNRPNTFLHYSVDHYLDNTDGNENAAGYDAIVDEGVRFPNAAGLDDGTLALLNPSDVNVANSGDFIVPAYTSTLRIDMPGYSSEQRMAQYTYETTTITQKTRSRERIRYGETFTRCSNSDWVRAGTYDPVTSTLRFPNGEVFQALTNTGALYAGALPVWGITRFRQVWVDYYDEPYWDRVTTTASISGQQVAQTFLNSQDGWMTQVGLYFSRVATTGDVNLLICDTFLGQPDLTQVISRTVLAQADMKVGAPVSAGLPSLVETKVPIAPTFLKAGKRYAIVLITAGDHYVAMTNADNAAIQGTFFASTDGAFFSGNLVDDMKTRIYFAKFGKTRYAIDLQPMQLAGGILGIDILREAITPPATSLTFEVQISGVWKPLNQDGGPSLAALPALLPLRAVFMGTTDLMPGVGIGADRSLVRLSRPKTAFKHVSVARTLGGNATIVKLVYLLEHFVEAQHDFTVVLKAGAGPATEAADVVADQTMPDGSVKRTLTFNITSAATYYIEASGAATSAAVLFHVAERVEYALAS
jgi:hypothetical protein